MHPLTERWWELFITRTDGALRQGPQGWIYTPARLTIHELDAALRGQVSLGSYAVDGEGLSRWLCLDADSPEGLEILVRIAEELNPATTLFELSRRGGHLWWLCPPTPWQRVQAVGKALTGASELIEVFPKSGGRTGVRLPLTRHPLTSQAYPVVDPFTGAIRSLAELVRLQTETLPQLALPKPTPDPRADYPAGADAYGQLVDEVERLTKLRQYAPGRAVGLCPFHDDHHPSLSVLGGFWRCWAGCGEGGIGAWRTLARQRRQEVRHDQVQTTQ